MERQGDFEEAERIRHERHADLGQAGKYELWAEARDLALAAWTEYRNERIDEAEALYRQALERAQRQGLFVVLGDIHNGLGKVAMRRGQYREAIRHYLEALDVWLVSDYFYGVQAVYFNVGVVYREWGGQFEQGGHRRQAKQMYELAAEWTERCVRLCETMLIGDDTSEAEAQLASLYVKLGKFGKAFKIALHAQQMAFRAKNQHSIIASARALAAAYLARSEPEQAAVVVRKSSDSLTERFRKTLAAQILKFFR